ncbi:hypothetical protein QYF36_003393 [Acer negundo]|nr:hypothetical protein QYF36_003393 [Acer negundo]
MSPIAYESSVLISYEVKSRHVRNAPPIFIISVDRQKKATAKSLLFHNPFNPRERHQQRQTFYSTLPLVALLVSTLRF